MNKSTENSSETKDMIEREFEELFGGAQDSAGLNDSHEKTLSERTNEIRDFRNAYLKFTGA